MLLGLNQGQGRKCYPIGNLKDDSQLICYYAILRYEKIGYWVIFVFCDNKYIELLENLVTIIMDMLCSFNNANWIYKKYLELPLNLKPRKYLIY